MHEEKKLVYIAGHNIIVYDMDEGTQQFIPGSANADEINHITLSPSGRFIAYCERAEPRAQVTVYEIAQRKKRKTLPEPEMDNLQFKCNEFLGSAFSPTNEKQHLVTLSGEGDWCVILWQWEAFKMLAKIDLNVAPEPMETKLF